MNVPVEMTDVINRVFELLGEFDLSAESICESINAPAGFLDDVKSGNATLQDQQICTIAEVFKVNPDYLRYGFWISPSFGFSTQDFLLTMLEQPNNPTENDKRIIRAAANLAKLSDQASKG